MSSTFWRDGLTETLSPMEKVVFIYLLTNEATNLLGIYPLSLRIAACDLQLDLDEFKAILEKLEGSGLVKYDTETRELAVRSWLRYQIHAGGTVIKNQLAADLGQVKSKELLTYVYSYLSQSKTVPAPVVSEFLSDLQDYMIS